MNWYCVHTQNLREHVAEVNIKRVDPAIETFFPRFRLNGAGSLKRTETPLFPTYLFARFDPDKHLGRYNSIEQAYGVSGVVQFAGEMPTVDERIINLLKKEFPEDGSKLIRKNYQKGDQVIITDGPFKGLNAVVSKEIPAKNRVAVLMEMLSTNHTIQIQPEHIRHTDSRHPLTRSISV